MLENCLHARVKYEHILPSRPYSTNSSHEENFQSYGFPQLFFIFYFFWEMRINYLIHSEITTDSWVPFVHSTALDQNPGMITSWTMQILVKGQTGKY